MRERGGRGRLPRGPETCSRVVGPAALVRAVATAPPAASTYSHGPQPTARASAMHSPRALVTGTKHSGFGAVVPRAQLKRWSGAVYNRLLGLSQFRFCVCDAVPRATGRPQDFTSIWHARVFTSNAPVLAGGSGSGSCGSGSSEPVLAHRRQRHNNDQQPHKNTHRRRAAGIEY